MKSLVLTLSLLATTAFAATPDFRGTWESSCQDMGGSSIKHLLTIGDNAAYSMKTILHMGTGCKTSFHQTVSSGTYKLGKQSSQTNNAYELDYVVDGRTNYDLIGLVDGKLYMGQWAGHTPDMRPNALDLKKPFTKK